MQDAIGIILLCVAAYPWTTTQAQGFRVRHYSLADGLGFGLDQLSRVNG